MAGVHCSLTGVLIPLLPAHVSRKGQLAGHHANDASHRTVPQPAEAAAIDIMVVFHTHLRFKSTVHRVVTKTAKDRYSCAFFW